MTGLDDVLNGGFPRDRFYLLHGDPGVGKTTIGLQFLLAGIAAHQRCLYITLSETAAELRSVAQSHGWSLDGVEVVELSALEQQSILEDDNTLFEPSDIELQETTRRVLEEVERVKPARVVFDSLSELRLLAQTPLRYRRLILGLKQYFATKRCTVLLLDDRTADRSDQQVMSIAHGVVLIEQSVPAYGSDRRHLRVMKLRGVQFMGGTHDCTIATGGFVVFPRLVCEVRRVDIPDTPSSTGLVELDALLGGGIDRTTSTLLIGPAGSGKSAIATRIAASACERGEKAAIFAFDERLATLRRRSLALGMDLDALCANGSLAIQQIDPAEMSPGEFAQRVRSTVDGGTRLIVIDSLNGYLQSMPEDRLLMVQLHELLTYLSQRDVSTILVTAQHGLVGTMTSQIDVSYLADTVLLLRYFEAAGRIRKAISIVKKRSGVHENQIRELTIGGGRIRVGEPLSEFTGVLSGVPRYEGNARELSK